MSNSLLILLQDKRHAARQLQDSYNERLADLEREAWEKHRVIRELHAEEQDMTDRVQQLRLEETKLAAKVSKHKRAREDMMDSRELNTVDGYEFVGGLRLDDAMFRSKGIQLSTQSRTPVLLRFAPTHLLIFNADLHRQASLAGGFFPTGKAKLDSPIKEIPYDRIMSVRQIDKAILEIVSQGYTSNVSLMCDNKEKRNSIQKLLMLKTKGVILSLASWTVGAAEVGCDEGSDENVIPVRNVMTDTHPSVSAMTQSQRSGWARSANTRMRCKSPTASAVNGGSAGLSRTMSSGARR